MKNLIFSTVLIVFATFFACKKKEETPPPATNSTSTTAGGTTTGGTTTGTSPGGQSSNLQTKYTIINTGGVIAKDSSIQANFYSAPVTSGIYSLVSAGNVSLNSVNIPTINGVGIGYYIVSNAPLNLQLPLTWSVSGSGTLKAFTHSLMPSYPKYTGGNLLPDTCSKAAGINLTINGVTNNPDNVVLVQLYVGSASALKLITSSNGIVSFSSQDLASFPTNSNLTIQLSWTNGNYATYGGIKHCFANNLQYIKYSYLKP